MNVLNNSIYVRLSTEEIQPYNSIETERKKMENELQDLVMTVYVIVFAICVATTISRIRKELIKTDEQAYREYKAQQGISNFFYYALVFWWAYLPIILPYRLIKKLFNSDKSNYQPYANTSH